MYVFLDFSFGEMLWLEIGKITSLLSIRSKCDSMFVMEMIWLQFTIQGRSHQDNFIQFQTLFRLPELSTFKSWLGNFGSTLTQKLARVWDQVQGSEIWIKEKEKNLWWYRFIRPLYWDIRSLRAYWAATSSWQPIEPVWPTQRCIMINDYDGDDHWSWHWWSRRWWSCQWWSWRWQSWSLLWR